MGYTGERCQDLVDNCVSGVCLNGGECINALNSFSCHCVPGFTGGFCDVNIDECASNPCHNRGICIDEVNDFYCVCPPSDGSPPKDCSGEIRFTVHLAAASEAVLVTSITCLPFPRIPLPVS